MPHRELSRDELKRERAMLHELKKFHRENQHLASPLATQFTKKRVRVPQVNPETNPFCMERQLADEYELLNLNKNPRFYIPSIKSSSRLEENPHNHSSSASRMYNPLSKSVVRSSGKPTSVKTGMSVMQLHELLTPSNQKQKSSQKLQPKDRVRVIELEAEHREAKQKALEDLEKGYQSSIYNPPRERKQIQFFPPTDQTTGQLIDKYRKLAAGKLPES
uniref:Uncharacterized protein n=1 Tax=Globisporangium ultimum (strain ATCC 200006 / CBS 805.95 / DAOM BR144) TaxID=431595 RepID=K3X7Z7_GLOUD